MQLAGASDAPDFKRLAQHLLQTPFVHGPHKDQPVAGPAQEPLQPGRSHTGEQVFLDAQPEARSRSIRFRA